MLNHMIRNILVVEHEGELLENHDEIKAKQSLLRQKRLDWIRCEQDEAEYVSDCEAINYLFLEKEIEQYESSPDFQDALLTNKI